LVTGGAGFIGSHLVEALLGRGHMVRVVDNFSTGKRENISGFINRIELLTGDLSESETARRAVDGISCIFHQAALGSVPRSVADPLSTHRSNVDGTLNLLIEARSAGVRRIVVAGSSSVYGANPALPKNESLLIAPLSPYAVTKAVQELYARAFFATYGLETVTLRFFNVYGPRQDPHSIYAAVIPRFITALLTKKQPVIYGDGEQTRDFTYVEDVVEANLKAMDADGAAGEVLNVAAGGQASINQLLHEISSIMGVKADPVHEPLRVGEVRHSRADNSRAKELLGWQPRTSLKEGLKKTVEYFRRQGL